MDLPNLRLPAPRPCEGCPYRRDVPAGVWDDREYAKLPPYDRDTARQPPGVFRCHVTDTEDPQSRVCAGWAHVHADARPGRELLALRLAVVAGILRPEDAYAVATYRTDVPCFASGAEAAQWGRRGPVTDATRELVDKIGRRRPSTLDWPAPPRRYRQQRRDDFG